jgi:DNA-binding MarR family transcriptional regulator
VQLTDTGRRLVSKAIAANTRCEATLLDGLSRKDQRSLGDLLRRLLSALEAPAGE